MARPKDAKYDTYARHRIAHRLLEVFPKYGNWNALAAAITEYRKIEFHRTDINRVRNGTAGDHILDGVIDWLESLDSEFRSKLNPESIFEEVGVSARDYYFHLFGTQNLQEWDDNLLSEFEGVYLCAPENDANSYLPSARVRAIFDKKLILPEQWRKQRSTDIRQYISQRSFLILKRTGAHYYHAAEVPMGALFPATFQSLDILSYYEGVGIASSNTIHVFLRECMTRVPKLHSILIRPKSGFQLNEVHGMKIYADKLIRYLPEEWRALGSDYRAQMREEFVEQINSEVFMRGTCQVNVSPLAWTKNLVEMVFGTEQVYHRKPKGFLKDTQTHFIRPDLENSTEIERLFDNPLIVSELL